MVIMKRTDKKMICGWGIRRAVRSANELSAMFGCGYYVISLNGSLKVVPKKTIKELIRRKRFKKGVTVETIERHALYITR